MNHIIHPLPDTHPEFTVVRLPGFTEYRVANYWLARDGSGRIVRGTIVWSWVDVGMTVVLALIVCAWFEAQGKGGHGHGPAVPALAAMPRHMLFLGVGIVLTWLVWTRCNQVLHESLLVFPALCIQLETHRGHPLLPFPISVTRHFIPLSALEDVVIHEGFRRWNVRYYLAALQRHKQPIASVLAAVSDECKIDASISVSVDEKTKARLECSHLSSPIEASDSIVEVHVAFKNILPYFPVLHAVYCGVQVKLFQVASRFMETETENGGEVHDMSSGVCV